MTTTTTPRAALPLLAAAQAQKHITHNDALLQLDALLFARFLSRNLSTPPATPADGDAYLVKATASGAWTGQNGQIAYASGGVWRFTAPFTGLTAYVVDEAKLVIFNGTSFVDYASTLALQNVPLLGVNACADATNKFAVSSSALLFNHVGNGVQVKLNKNAATDTASVLYQTGFSGRAEIGLTGDDNFHFKVSPDGTTFNEAIRLANSNGHVLVNTTTDNGALTVGGVVAPDTNNIRDLGTASFAFRKAYVGTELNFLGTAVTAKTGTGSLVLSASPTLTGTLTAANGNFTGNLGVNQANPLALLELGGAMSATGPTATDKGILQVSALSNSVGLSIGNYQASPFSMWLQAMDNRSGQALTYPISLNPAGGSVFIGRNSTLNGNHCATATSTNPTIDFINAHASSPAGATIAYSAAAPNGTVNSFLACVDTAATRVQLRSNGGIANFSANNVNLSDARVKPVVEPLDNLAAQLWSAHRAVRWSRFKYHDQKHGDWNYGYVAQDIREQFRSFAPELVDRWDDGGSDLLAVYHEDLHNIGHAVLSAAQRRIEALEVENAKLGAALAETVKRVVSLESKRNS